MRADPWEVIVVNDGGREKLQEKKRNLLHIDNPINLGVGRSFDIGVSAAKYDTLFLSCSDITHPNSDYVEALYESAQENPKALTCTVCTSYQNHNHSDHAADVLFKITEDDLPNGSKIKKTGLPHRSILEGRWRPKTGNGTYQVPSLMGSFYSVKKEWYDHIRGFNMHYIWGSLEPYISLKSWLLGGEILLNTDVNVLHKTARVGHAVKPEYAYVYNRLMIAFIVFGAYGIQFMEHLGQNSSVQRAAEIYQDSMAELAPLRAHIEENAVMSAEELHEKMVELSYFYNK